MGMKTDPLSIGAFAEAAGVNVETIRFYQRKGLLPEPREPQGCIRRYGKADVARVRFFKSAQRLGLSLDEVDGILMLDEGAHCNRARLLAEHKLVDVRSKLADLLRIESVLSAMVDDCCAGRSKVSCPLIAALHDPPLGTRSDGPRRVR